MYVFTIEDPILLGYGNGTASLGNLILTCSGNMVSLSSGVEMSKMILPEEWDPHLHCCGNLTTHIIYKQVVHMKL
jgi:predicted esterase